MFNVINQMDLETYFHSSRDRALQCILLFPPAKIADRNRVAALKGTINRGVKELLLCSFSVEKCFQILDFKEMRAFYNCERLFIFLSL